MKQKPEQLSNSVSLLISVIVYLSLPLSRLLSARQRHQRLHLRADPDDGAEVSDAQTDATLQIRPGTRGKPRSDCV